MKRIRLCVPALALLGVLAIPASARAQNQLEQIALGLLAQKFGTNSQQALNFQSVSRQSAFDLAPIYSTSYYTHRSVNDVWALRQQGLGWGEIAHRLGMNPGRFNKLRRAGAFDRDAIWGSIYRDRYGARDADIVAIRRRGGSMRDALPTFIIARASHRDPIAVYSRYEKDRDWDRTASAYKVDWRNDDTRARRTGSATNARPAQAGVRRTAGRSQRDAIRNEVGQGNGRRQGIGQRGDGREGPTKNVDRNRGQGKGHFKGRGNGNDQGASPDRGNGHGKGNGNGRGNGQGKGNGNGQGKGNGNGQDDGQGHGEGNGGHGKSGR